MFAPGQLPNVWAVNIVFEDNYGLPWSKCQSYILQLLTGDMTVFEGDSMGWGLERKGMNQQVSWLQDQSGQVEGPYLPVVEQRVQNGI